MRIGVVSDSHGYLYMLDKAIARMGNTDMIIHAGDGIKDIIKVNSKYNANIDYIRGNNDYSLETPSEKVILIDGIKIFLTHGSDYGVHFGVERLFYRAKEEEADIVIYGHTHLQRLDEYENMMLLNPGSVSLPRDQKPGYAVIDIEGRKINIELFKLELA